MADKGMTIHLKIWRQARGSSEGQASSITPSRACSHEMSFLEMLDILNEQLVKQGRRGRRVRQRLPGGDLRHLRPGDQRGGPRHPGRLHYLRDPHAQFKDGDTITIEPFRAGPSRCSRTWWSTARPSTASSRQGRLRHRQRGLGPRRQRDPRPQGRRRQRHGRRGLHRLRRLRGGLPQRLGLALRVAPRSASSRWLPQGEAERKRRALADGGPDGRARASATAPTTANARRSAPRRSRSRTSR
jgi:hypothetical protein